jgi:hypothetical protein
LDGLFYSLAVVNKYWAVVVPGILGGVLLCAYSAPGYLGDMARDAIDPILQSLAELVGHIFGGLIR